MTEDKDPSAKKNRFGDWASENDALDDVSMRFEDEMRLYLMTGKPDSEDPNMLLSWWKLRQHCFPNLSRLARKILAIPATSASAERNFSRAGLVVSDKRSSISAQNVNDILLIHNYLVRFFPPSRILCTVKLHSYLSCN